MLIFPHEMIKREREYAERTIQRIKKNLPKLNLYYDITALAYNHGFTGDYSNYSVSLYIPEGYTIQHIHDLLDDIEEEILFDWELDVKNTRKYTSSQEYVYMNASKPFDIKIFIRNPHCKTVKTGKMIEEIRLECNLS